MALCIRDLDALPTDATITVAAAPTWWDWEILGDCPAAEQVRERCIKSAAGRWESERGESYGTDEVVGWDAQVVA